ncbi:MAG: hypoxanthine phosphoribosyltransferase [Deltaproteobacteria bacterium]|jgi:hypoxanthine phosphoribosyltransferase|nr:hypoxanthine phosphoribosyltransferase [Deltaproteobacteria bacterium]
MTSDNYSLKPLVSKEDINLRVTELGTEISNYYREILADDEYLLVIGVLNGAFVFMADLIRNITVPLEIDFVRLSSYQDSQTSSSKVVMLKDLECEISNRHVLVVEDIADIGLTLNWLLQHINSREPASLKLAVAVNKTGRREYKLDIDYVGFEANDEFLVGYGLDFSRHHRELPGLYAVTGKG